jgi:predicted alpha/beta-fold hydrolase
MWLIWLIWDTLVHSVESGQYKQRETLECSDGHTVSIWFTDLDNNTTDLILLCPGFYDNWQRGYIRQTIKAIHKLNAKPNSGTGRRMTAAVFHKPFVQDPPTTDTLPVYTDPLHLLECIRLIQERHPTLAIHLLGFSAGGNLVMRVAQESQSQPQDLFVNIQSVTSACSPLDVHHLHGQLQQHIWLNRLLWIAFLFSTFVQLAFKFPAKWFWTCLAFACAWSYTDMTSIIHQKCWSLSDQEVCEQQSVLKYLQADEPRELKRTVVFATNDPVVPVPPQLHPQVHRLSFSDGGHLGFHQSQWVQVLEHILGNNIQE